MIQDIQQKIMRLKQEQDVCILAHSYQAREILEIADYSGDSYQLSVLAQQVPNQTVFVCGVRFMAETVKILSPEKKVLLSNPIAGCPMAEQMDKEMIVSWKQQHPDYTVVAYVNTTAELKTVCDVCVTSASAVDVVRNIENDNILFIPDCNLGQYVADQLPDKNIQLLDGGCPIHAAVTKQHAIDAKQAHPCAKLLVHPECVPEVAQQADFVGSTSAIMNYAKQSDHTEFIIGTENSIAEHLQYDCPDKQFYLLSKELLCPDMKATTLMDVYHILQGQGREEIQLEEEVLRDAKRCMDEMIRLGK